MTIYQCQQQPINFWSLTPDQQQAISLNGWIVLGDYSISEIFSLTGGKGGKPDYICTPLIPYP